MKRKRFFLNDCSASESVIALLIFAFVSSGIGFLGLFLYGFKLKTAILFSLLPLLFFVYGAFHTGRYVFSLRMVENKFLMVASFRTLVLKAKNIRFCSVYYDRSGVKIVIKSLPSGSEEVFTLVNEEETFLVLISYCKVVTETCVSEQDILLLKSKVKLFM